VSEPPVATERHDHVTLVELRRPPHNFVDHEMLAAVADAVEAADADPACRAVVVAAAGTAFCAGVNFGAAAAEGDGGPGAAGAAFRGAAERFYEQATRLFRVSVPLVAAVHGAAVGGGLGLALACDLRVACPEARLAANFVRLGIHPGFGLSVTLPELVGPSRAADLLLTGRRVGGEEARSMGLVDRCVARDDVRAEALRLAAEIAAAAPLAVVAVRATLRRGLADRVEAALTRELDEQARLAATDDAREGIEAVFGRREPAFRGR